MSNAEELSGFDFARLADVRALKPRLLYPYQSDGVAFLLSKKRAVLGDDMGLGKTRQAIVSMQMGAPEGMRQHPGADRAHGRPPRPDAAAAARHRPHPAQLKEPR